MHLCSQTTTLKDPTTKRKMGDSRGGTFADPEAFLNISAFNSGPRAAMQTTIPRKPLDQLYAFIFHPPGSNTLRDSTYIWYNEQESLTADLKVVDGCADLTVREMTGEEDKFQHKASESLRSFCQVIDVQPKFAGGPLFGVGTLLQALMQLVQEEAQDGKLQSAQPPEKLPLGIERLWRITGRPLQKKLEKLSKEEGSIEPLGKWRVCKVLLPGASKTLFDFHPLQAHKDPPNPEARHWSLCVNTADTRFVEQFGSDDPLQLVSTDLPEKQCTDVDSVYFCTVVPWVSDGLVKVVPSFAGLSDNWKPQYSPSSTGGFTISSTVARCLG